MPTLSPSAFARLVTTWLGAKIEEKRWNDVQREKNEQIKTLIKKYGVLDPNDGHYYYDGVQPDGQRQSIRMVVKRPVYMDPDLAESILQEKGLVETYSEYQVEVTDEDLAAESLQLAGLDDGKHGFELQQVPTPDSVREAFYAGHITEEEYAAIFTEKEEYSLTLVKEKGS